MKINPAGRQALKQLWKLSGDDWWTSNERFFNANAANALVRNGLFERQPAANGRSPRYRITSDGRAFGDNLFQKAGS